MAARGDRWASFEQVWMSISHLRRKLGDDSETSKGQNHSGVGIWCREATGSHLSGLAFILLVAIFGAQILANTEVFNP